MRRTHRVVRLLALAVAALLISRFGSGGDDEDLTLRGQREATSKLRGQEEGAALGSRATSANPSRVIERAPRRRGEGGTEDATARRPARQGASPSPTGSRSSLPYADLPLDSRSLDSERGESDTEAATLDGATASSAEPRHGWIVLDPAEVTVGAISTRITGFDYGAPRALTLWRVSGERAAIFSEARSQSDGRFDFGQTVIPLRGLMLVVTEDGREPDAWERDDALAVFAQLPPPRIVSLEGDRGAERIEIRPALPGGTIILADAHFVEVERISLSTDLASIALIRNIDDATWVAHELDDGRTSDWLRIDR